MNAFMRIMFFVILFLTWSWAAIAVWLMFRQLHGRKFRVSWRNGRLPGRKFRVSWRKVAAGEFPDRLRLSDGAGNVYLVFDPPWWRVDRWLWWVYQQNRVEVPTRPVGRVMLNNMLDGQVRAVRVVLLRRAPPPAPPVRPERSGPTNFDV
jgi:hypothetical protein